MPETQKVKEAYDTVPQKRLFVHPPIAGFMSWSNVVCSFASQMSFVVCGCAANYNLLDFIMTHYGARTLFQ
jgi:hypothetical protein